jgi:hypothetical protein
MKPRCSNQRNHALTITEVLVVIVVLRQAFQQIGVATNRLAIP